MSPYVVSFVRVRFQAQLPSGGYCTGFHVSREGPPSSPAPFPLIRKRGPGGSTWFDRRAPPALGHVLLCDNVLAFTIGRLPAIYTLTGRFIGIFITQ